MKNKIKKSFDKNHNTYDNNSIIQQFIADLIINKLLKTFKKNFDNIIELGCGTGILTKKIYDNIKLKKMVCYDFSEKCINLTKSKIISDRVIFKIEDCEKIKLSDTEKFDLIISNSVIQWFNKPEVSIKNIYSKLNKNGVVILSMFGNKTFNELNCCINKVLGNQYNIPAKNFYNIDKIKQKFNFINNFNVTEYVIHKNYNNLIDLLKNIKYTGTYGNGLNSNKIFTKNKIRLIEQEYLNKYNQIKVTYNFFVLEGRK